MKYTDYPVAQFTIDARGSAGASPGSIITFSKDLEFHNDTPIFCTTKHDFIYVKGGVIDQVETEMMAVQRKAFQFQRQILQNKQLSIQPYATCFC